MRRQSSATSIGPTFCRFFENLPPVSLPNMEEDGFLPPAASRSSVACLAASAAAFSAASFSLAAFSSAAAMAAAAAASASKSR